MQSLPIIHQSLKEKQRQAREVLILQIAEEVFLEKGFYEASMDEIAARVGIAKGTIYLHFPGKEELVVAIIQRDIQTLLQEIDAVIAPLPSAREKISALLRLMYTGFFSKHTQLISSIYNGVDMRRRFAEQGSCMYELGKSLTMHIEVVLEQGKAAGEFDTNLSTSVMLHTLLNLFSPRSYGYLLLKAEPAPEVMMEQMEQIYFRGIAACKSPEAEA